MTLIFHEFLLRPPIFTLYHFPDKDISMSSFRPIVCEIEFPT